MRAVDTNVLARFILMDDPAQLPVAIDVIQSGIFVSLSVWMELAWLLSARYRIARDAIAESFDALLAMPTVTSTADAHWVVDRYKNGADIADMVHVAEALSQSAFATFDDDIRKRAGSAPPVAVETLFGL